METGASNYRAAATLQGAICTYLYPGCLASAAFNYDPTANQAGLCVPVRRGCMTQGALNFQPNPNPNPNPNHNPNRNPDPGPGPNPNQVSPPRRRSAGRSPCTAPGQAPCWA